MISVCYIIVCVNLLCSYSHAETLSPTKTWKKRTYDQKLLLNTLTVDNQDEYLANIVSPYWNLTYHEQLDKKQNRCSAIVEIIMKRSKILTNPITCKLRKIVPSPITKAYRNRDDFHVRYGVDGNPKTVGLIVADFSHRMRFSIPPTKIVTIKESHKRVAQVYEDFIRLSPAAACSDINDGGHWRKLLVRSNEAGEVLACVSVQIQRYTNKTIQEQQQALKAHFSKHLPNITLFQQQCNNTRSPEDVAPFILLYGKQYLMETLKGYKFKISPGSSFPINKLGAEVLYETIIRTTKLKQNITVLDICSGSGAISILASKLVLRVVGIESDARAVADAKYNARLNNIHNINFRLGKTEVILKSVLKSLNNSADIVAIVSPGNAGLRLDVIRTIRRSINISRLLYISSKIQSPKSVQNFIDLCSTNTSKFKPFRLTKAIPVDLLPQTAQVELIFMFQRSLRRKH